MNNKIYFETEEEVNNATSKLTELALALGCIVGPKDVGIGWQFPDYKARKDREIQMKKVQREAEQHQQIGQDIVPHIYHNDSGSILLPLATGYLLGKTMSGSAESTKSAETHRPAQTRNQYHGLGTRTSSPSRSRRRRR